MCSFSIVSFYYLHLFLIRLSLTPANSSLRSIQLQRSVSVIPRSPRSVSVFLVFGLSLSHLLFYTVLVLIVFVSSLAFSPRFGRDIPIICHR